VLAREQDGLLQVVETGDRALRVGRRAQIHDLRPVERRRIEGVEIGQEVGRARRRHQHRVGPGEQGRAEIDLVERVGDEGERARALVAAGDAERRRHVEAFARAGAWRDHRLGIDHAGRQLVPARQPVRAGLAELGRAVDRRVAVPVLVARDDVADELGRAVLRLADRERDRLDIGAWADALDQRGEALKGIVAQRIETCVEHGSLDDLEKGGRKAADPSNAGPACRGAERWV
jgi:hypothetical protein